MRCGEEEGFADECLAISYLIAGSGYNAPRVVP